jgi:hypothetical protein
MSRNLVILDIFTNIMNQDSSVGIVTNYGLACPGSIRCRDLLHSVQTGSSTHPGSCRMSTGVSFPGVKLTTVLEPIV